jgi:cytochrome c oxidase subunit 3/cytochrome o ubiquinol oxidase subunit 3
MARNTMAQSHEREFRAGHELGLDHVKLGMWIFIASEVMFFGGLIAAFLKYKFQNPSPEQALLDVALVGGNTFVLLTSSFTVVLGLAALRGGNRGAFLRYMGLTILLGVAFLGGQGYEFATLFGEGVTPTTSLFGSSFFTLTGFHGLHVLIGVIWALVVVGRGLRGAFGPEDDRAVEIFGLYWHFVDIVWIVLFTLIYLI